MKQKRKKEVCTLSKVVRSEKKFGIGKVDATKFSDFARPPSEKKREGKFPHHANLFRSFFSRSRPEEKGRREKMSYSERNWSQVAKL